MTQQRSDILAKIRTASSLKDQGAAVAELDRFDRQAREATASASSADWAGMVVQETLAPATAHERSTIETDWLGEVTASDGEWANKVTAEAALWYRRVSEAVKEDPEEFAEQLKGIARRTASAYGEDMIAAEETFTSYIAFLHRQAASGLPQVEQLVDSQENPAQTPLPEDTFDNFAPPVHPINEGVVGTETSERAPLIQEIERNGGEGGGDPSHHDETQQFSGPAPVQAQPGVQGTTALFVPSVAIGYAGNLTEVLASLQSQAASCGCPGVDDGDPHMSDCPIKTGGGGYGRDPYDAYDDDYDGYHEGSKKEGASSLDQIQQVVDNQENPKPTPLNPEVAFPWMLEEEPDEEERSDVKKSSLTPAQARDAHVARLVAKRDEDLTETDRKEIQAYAASLFKTADQWGQGGPQYQGPGAANTPATTPVGTGGSEQAGESAGQADRAAGDAPTFSDASSSVPPFVQGYADGYGTGQTQLPGAVPGQLPPGAGGMGEYQTHAASLQTTAKQVSCDNCGKQDSHFNMQQRGNGSSVGYQCNSCAPTPSDPSKVRWQGSLKVSAAFVSPIEAADPDFAKAYKYASKWKDGTRLVTQGSAAFEAGLYAGMSDNSPEAQAAWCTRHEAASQRYKDAQYAKRIGLHLAFTKQASSALGAMVNGAYLNPMPPKTAATTTDLDTMGPGVSPSATGQTPINGPGTPPPLEGGTDPARPGGPAPYNGVAPFGTPAVPTGMHVEPGAPAVVDTTPGGPMDQAAQQRLSPQNLAFRQTVQAGLLSDKTAR